MERPASGLGSASGKRLALTIAAGAAAAATLGFVSWWVQTRLMGVSSILKQQIVTVQVYGVLVGALMIGFRPPKAPPLVLRRAPLLYYLIAPLLLAGVIVSAAAIYFAATPITGGLRQSAREILAIATDVKRLDGAPLHALVVALFRGVIVVPLFEESLFRGVLLGWLAEHVSVGWAAACSATLFALAHGFPIVMPYASLFGLAATWLRVHSGSLLPGFAMHALNSVVLFGVATCMLK